MKEDSNGPISTGKKKMRIRAAVKATTYKTVRKEDDRDLNDRPKGIKSPYFRHLVVSFLSEGTRVCYVKETERVWDAS